MTQKAAPSAAVPDVRGLSWPRRPAEAFGEVLSELRDTSALHGRPVGDVLSRLVTLGGRIPFTIAVDALTPWEAAVLLWLLGRDEPVLSAPGELPDDASTIVVAQSAMGTVALRRSTEPDPEGEVALGAFVLAPDANEATEEIVDETAALEEYERSQLDEMLLEIEAQGALEAVVDDVIDHVDHVESVYIHVDGSVCARSDIGNTLLREGMLASLKAKPLARWEPAERLFVAAFHVLFAAGRSMRLEEFNGRVLTAARLRQWLIGRLFAYSAALREPVSAGAPSEPFLALAKRVAELRARLEQNGAFGFRRIFGLTLIKQERVRPLATFRHEPDELPPLVARLADEWDVELQPGATSPYEAMSKLAAFAVRTKAEAPERETTEILLERIVLANIIEGGGDYGMSSSVRDLRRLKPRDARPSSGALELQKPDFFCVCLPHPALVNAVEQSLLCEMLNAVALRMQFNRWHFIVGNFDRDDVPGSRHFFYPPGMPDMAQLSEARHGGHTLAWVRYSIRAPGPQLWRPPLSVYGNEYRGCFDTRLVRLTEPPFTRQEMATSSRHTTLMDAFWRTACRLVESGEVDTPIVTGFDRLYYEDEDWRRVTELASQAADDPGARARLSPRQLRT